MITIMSEMNKRKSRHRFRKTTALWFYLALLLEPLCGRYHITRLNRVVFVSCIVATILFIHWHHAEML